MYQAELLNKVLKTKVDLKPKFCHWSQPQRFGLGLKHLALAWARSTAEEPAAKKRRTSLFADYRTSHNAEGKRTDDRR